MFMFFYMVLLAVPKSETQEDTFYVFKMGKSTSCYIIMSIIQAIFAFLLIPGYIICTSSSYPILWKAFFYSSSAICHSSIKACAISNGIYATFNGLVCFASLMTSIMLAVRIGNVDNLRPTKVLLTWIIVDVIFIIHHILLHIFTISSIKSASRNLSDYADLGIAISVVVLLPFSISMLVSIGFIFPMISFYRCLRNKEEQEKENARTVSPIPLVPMENYQYNQYVTNQYVY